MQTNNVNNHYHPPPPPLSVNLPSPTRPEPDEFPHSPLHSDSSLRSDDPDNNTALVPVSAPAPAPAPVENYYSPLTSPLPPTPPPPLPPPHQIVQFSRREEPPPQSGVVHGGERGEEGRRERKEKGVKRERVTVGGVERVELGIRVLEIVLCLISFSVMASDKTQGWSGDSFDRYKEYRFCLTIAVFGFVYSAFQAYDLGSYLVTRKHVINHRLRYPFDFVMDQILAYLLISASSAAASRVDDWQVNWGKDEFTAKASASISMAFLAFFCFAMSSIISGYNLCNPNAN